LYTYDELCDAIEADSYRATIIDIARTDGAGCGAA